MTTEIPVNLTIPYFAVRCNDVMSLAEMAAKVSNAIGCRLAEGEYHKLLGARGILLGMDVGLYEWGGVRGRTFRFEGEVESSSFVDFMRDKLVHVNALDLSQVVVDVLTVETGTSWRIPTAEDLAAEKTYGDELERRFASEP